MKSQSIAGFALAALTAFAGASPAFGESADLANRVADSACPDGAAGASCRARVVNAVTRAPSMTRNIGTEDPNAIQGTGDSWHPASRAACRAKVLSTGAIRQNPAFKQKCGAGWMVPVPKAGETQATARVCIDQFEFPNLPCEYPVAWTPVGTAKRVCESMGKRLCNSYEWEGGCAGSIDMTAPYKNQRAEHNAKRAGVWAFQWQSSLSGVRETRGLCGVYSPNDPEIDPTARAHYTLGGKSSGCDRAIQTVGGNVRGACGTNTWPAGFKNQCVSSLGVYDMHGNVAEVTSLPGDPGQIADMSGRAGWNEHKGSFFVHRGDYPDDCRVRQPEEHYIQIPMSSDAGIAFYQEGFRCCKDVQ